MTTIYHHHPGQPPSKPCTAGPTEWRVAQYRCNHSAFNGYRKTPSDYSLIQCLRCGYLWRSKAKYTNGMPMITPQEKLQADSYID